MNLDANFALVVVAVVAITAMALTIGKPENLRQLASFIEKLLKAIGRFLW
jgi:hypothetical protein